MPKIVFSYSRTFQNKCLSIFGENICTLHDKRQTTHDTRYTIHDTGPERKLSETIWRFFRDIPCIQLLVSGEKERAKAGKVEEKSSEGH